MSISAADYTAWLNNPSGIRNILVEAYPNISGADTLIKLSQKAFNDYTPILKSSITYAESISITGTPSISIGDIEVDNTNGEFNYALNYIYSNRIISIFIGDVSWDASDYRQIFEGVMVKLIPKSREILAIKIQDKMQRLNAPATETTLGGTTANKDAVLPVLLGEGCNITPLLIDPITRTYQYNALPANGLVELREDTLPVSIQSENAATGTFIPLYGVKGTLTCSAQGHKVGGTTYSNKIGDIVAALATEGGVVANRFSSGEVDYTNIAAFNALYPHPVGYYIAGKENILSVMQALSSSVEAQVTTTRLGKLRLLTLVPGTSTKTLTDANWIEKSFYMKDITDVIGSIKLGFCKNWTVQSDIKASIPEDHKEIWATEWRTTTYSDATTITNYKLSVTPTEINTFLLREADAITEATRRVNFWKNPHKIYTFQGDSSCLELELGQTITLQTYDYNLSSGVVGVITSLSFDWLNYSVTVEVFT